MAETTANTQSSKEPAAPHLVPEPTAKPEEKKKTWIEGIAISTAVLAVVAAFTSAEGGRASSRAIILQSQESDQWSFYQAKSIKGHTYSLQAELLEAAPSARGRRFGTKGRARALPQRGRAL